MQVSRVFHHLQLKMISRVSHLLQSEKISRISHHLQSEDPRLYDEVFLRVFLPLMYPLYLVQHFHLSPDHLESTVTFWTMTSYHYIPLPRVVPVLPRQKVDLDRDLSRELHRDRLEET